MSRETIDFDPQTQFTSKGDESMFCLFYMHYIRDEEATEKEGRPIYKDTPFVKMFAPGDRNNIVDRPMRTSDQMRFPRQYAMFKAGQEQRATGMPLEEWSVISKGVAEELKFFGFQTVEQLALASDEVCSKRMGMGDLRNKAKAYLQVAAGDTKPMAEMSATIAQQASTIEVLQDNLREMTERLAALEKTSKK